MTENAKTVDALYNPQWGRMVQVDAEFHAMMQEHGFEPTHTGGGCMGWQKDLSDNEYILITNDDLDLDSERGDPSWIVGRYLMDDTSDCCWYCVSGVDVPLALEIAGKLPRPTGDYCVSLPDSEFA